MDGSARGRHGSVIGVISGCGGAGGSVFAATLAGCAAARGDGPVVLLDCDPLSGGVDVLLGCERQPGVRWSDVRIRGGVIDPVTLLRSLPQWDGVSFLAADSPSALPVSAVRAVLEAAMRVGRVVVDLPRWPSEARSVALASCADVVLITAAEIRSVTASATVAAALDPERCSVVVRGAGRPLSPERIGQLLGLPVAGTFPFDPAASRPAGLQVGALRRATRQLAHRVLDRSVQASDAA